MVVKKGRFLDREVQGLLYVSSQLAGTTDVQGTFEYTAGATLITFHLGNIEIGEGQPASVMTPINLVEGTESAGHPTVNNISGFLQTLDDDGNPDNGILIAEEVSFAATTAVNFDVSPAQFENNVRPIVQILTALTEAGRRDLISAAEAQAHLEATLNAPTTIPPTTAPPTTAPVATAPPTTAPPTTLPPVIVTVPMRFSDPPLVIARTTHFQSIRVTTPLVGSTYTFIVSGNVCINRTSNCTNASNPPITLSGIGNLAFTLTPMSGFISATNVCARRRGSGSCVQRTINIGDPQVTLASTADPHDIIVNANPGSNYTLILSRQGAGADVCVNGASNCTSAATPTITLDGSGTQTFTLTSGGGVQLSA